MDYEWDEDKARTHLAKHGVDFAEAALVLEDELALTAEDHEKGIRLLARQTGAGGAHPEG